MNDTEKTDLSVTDGSDINWDKHIPRVQCDKCSCPVNLDDEDIYVSESKVYCKECTDEIENRLSFMDNIKRDKFHFYYPFLDENKQGNQ